MSLFGLLRLLFAPARKTTRARTLPDFRQPSAIAEQAFWEIMADIDAPEDRIQRLWALWRKAGNERYGRYGAWAVEAAFQGDVLGESIEWGEAYFGDWRKRFAEADTFPYTWERLYPELCHPPPPLDTIEDALQCDGSAHRTWTGNHYLTVPKIRKLAVDLYAMPARKRPTKRVDLVALLIGTGRTAEIVEAAMPQYQTLVRLHGVRREKAKCTILADMIHSRAAALKAVHDASDPKRNSVLSERVEAIFARNCPVEMTAYEEASTAETARLPPFFPGDRTRLRFAVKTWAELGWSGMKELPMEGGASVSLAFEPCQAKDGTIWLRLYRKV